MLGAILFEDEDLVKKAFDLFLLQLSKTRTLIGSLKSLFFVGDVDQFKELYKIGKIAAKLSHEADRSELWINDMEKSSDWIFLLDDLNVLLKGEKIRFSHVRKHANRIVNNKSPFQEFCPLEDISLHEKDMARIFIHNKGYKGLLHLLKTTCRINGILPVWVVNLQLTTINTMAILASLVPPFSFELLKETSLFVKILKR